MEPRHERPRQPIRAQVDSVSVILRPEITWGPGLGGGGGAKRNEIRTVALPTQLELDSSSLISTESLSESFSILFARSRATQTLRKLRGLAATLSSWPATGTARDSISR